MEFPFHSYSPSCLLASYTTVLPIRYQFFHANDLYVNLVATTADFVDHCECLEVLNLNGDQWDLLLNSTMYGRLLRHARPHTLRAVTNRLQAPSLRALSTSKPGMCIPGQHSTSFANRSYQSKSRPLPLKNQQLRIPHRQRTKL
jgi:hypothetical protein